MTTVIGAIAGLFTAGCLIPQIVKTHRTKSTGDFSLLFLTAMTTGAVLWAIYGLLLRSIPIVATNALCIAQMSYLLYMKARQGRSA
jgi:MtN3 and saliva related transmembrane protein